MKKKLSIEDFILFLIPYAIFLIIFCAHYPGIMTYDSWFQWNEVQSGTLSNGHPFLSTYFMFLISKIWNSPTAIFVYQMLIYSLFWSIMCHYTRTKTNFFKQCIYTFFISLIPLISIYSFTMWKDILYTYYLVMIGFMTYLICYKQKYKVSIKQFIILGLLTMLVYSYRVNGIIVAILYLIFFTILYLKKNKEKRKNVLAMFLTFILLLGIVSIPKKEYLKKYSEANPPKHVGISTIDNYASWIWGEYLRNGSVEEKDKEFLNNFMDTTAWADRYDSYCINSLFDTKDIDYDWLSKHESEYHNLFIKYTLKYPNLFISHYLKADSLLYNPLTNFKTYVYVFTFDYYELYHFEGVTKSMLPGLEEFYGKFVNFTFRVPFSMFYQPGLILFACIGICIYISKKYKNKCVWYMCVPMFLNTISLLPINIAQDLRYCYINYLTLDVLGLIYISCRSKYLEEVMNMNKTDKTIKGKKDNKVLIIIPAYNEEECIESTVNSIIEYNKKFNTSYDYVVINDGSTDHTEDVLLHNNINHVKLIHNLGIGGAVQTGYKYAYDNNYDIAIQYDGDGQHDIYSVKDIIKPIIDGKKNMVIGSRFVNKDLENFQSSWLRRLGINILSGVIKYKTGKKIYDTTSGFRAIDRCVMKLFVKQYPIEYPEPISTVNVLLNGYHIGEVPAKMKPRVSGKSSIHTWKDVYYMINVIMSMLLMGRVK